MRNGALIRYKGETISFTPADDEGMREILSEVRKYRWARPLISEENCAYIETDETPFSLYAREAYTNCAVIDDLEKAIGREKICKMAVFDRENNSAERVMPLEKKFPSFKVVASGSC